MTKKILQLSLALLAILFISCKQVDKVHVVLLAGQSNMEGAGNYNALDVETQARISKISERVSLSVKGGDSTPLSYQLSQHHKEKYGFAERFGPEMFMALELAEANPEQEYLFIKYAQGGTSLYGAWNPVWDADKAAAAENQDFKKKLKLYSLHLSGIKRCLESLTASGKEYEIIGMAWMQGENDAAKEMCSRSYEDNLKNLIASYRDEFGEEMPFVVGQINSTYGRFSEGPAMVRKAMADVAMAEDKVGIIETTTDPSWSDFPKHTDNVHYNTEGQSRLGTAMAKELVRLQ